MINNVKGGNLMFVFGLIVGGVVGLVIGGLVGVYVYPQIVKK